MIGPISPFFVVTDVPRSLALYCDRLGFELRYAVPEEPPFFAVVVRDGAQLLLEDPRQSASETVQPRPNHRYEWAPWDAFVLAPDPEAVAPDFEARGLTLPDGVHERSDGLRGFEVRDPDGYVLFFGRPT